MEKSQGGAVSSSLSFRTTTRNAPITINIKTANEERHRSSPSSRSFDVRPPRRPPPCQHTHTLLHTLTGFAVLLIRAAVAAVAEEVALQLRRDAALVAAGELRLPAGPRSPGHHLCRSGVKGHGLGSGTARKQFVRSMRESSERLMLVLLSLKWVVIFILLNPECRTERIEKMDWKIISIFRRWNRIMFAR